MSEFEGSSNQAVRAMNEQDATSICDRLRERIVESPNVQVDDLWVASADDEWSVVVVFRQGGGPKLGLRQTSLWSFAEGDRELTPVEMAGDIFLFVIEEPHDPELIPLADDGVRWFVD